MFQNENEQSWRLDPIPEESISVSFAFKTLLSITTGEWVAYFTHYHIVLKLQLSRWNLFWLVGLDTYNNSFFGGGQHIFIIGRFWSKIILEGISCVYGYFYWEGVLSA